MSRDHWLAHAAWCRILRLHSSATPRTEFRRSERWCSIYPGDERLRAVDDAYLVGDRMLVAPLFAGEVNRKIIMPAGSWHDFWTGAAVQGGAELTVPASTQNIPVYVKAGSIIPWANVSPFAGHEESRQLTARIYGDGSLPFVLRVGEQTLYLNQANRDAKATATGYTVHSWKQMLG
jgi:alpha-D-xyloside xylohydrolase